ncbi:MAG: hypothetical protein HYZ62_01845 [Candidatus Andersenbacteria bacterium]|nr:hypothetical protein [Candidatus Andersenbacteria bacterium]
MSASEWIAFAVLVVGLLVAKLAAGFTVSYFSGEPPLKSDNDIRPLLDKAQSSLTKPEGVGPPPTPTSQSTPPNPMAS